MIRPQPATWFEVIAGIDDAGGVLESLAAAGCAEIEPVARRPAGGTAARQQGGTLPSGEIFTRITGWTSDAGTLAACLERAHARAVVHFPKAPDALQPPLILSNPGWVQPFEIFARLVGMPGRFGTDPSGLLVFVAPVLFGYMFGDVIQGIVLIMVGLAGQRHWPMLRLLVAGGIATTVFGFVFGSAGAIHGVIPALWVAPLDEPLSVLLVPIAFGGALLTLGLALTGLEAYWRGQLAHWLCRDAGFLGLYVGVLLAFLHPAGQVLAAAGLGMHIFGRLWLERRMSALLASFGELTEKLAQILINTVSFVRVGAFALAHAGLSSALASMVKPVEGSVCYFTSLIAGNAVIIVIEVMVASIQTTRLVLFEFFTRFFETTGREFHPLPRTSGSSEEIRNVPRT
jgi:V/A-type H+-transporting ATPase subunit I